jgi:hypothetical protein
MNDDIKIGLGVPHLGHFADPDATRAVAVAADAAGFSSLWAMGRLLAPVVPRTLGYPGSADGSLPRGQQRVRDQLVTLTLAAAVTDRIRVGTDVLVAHWYPPVLLARGVVDERHQRDRDVAGTDRREHRRRQTGPESPPADPARPIQPGWTRPHRPSRRRLAPVRGAARRHLGRRALTQ